MQKNKEYLEANLGLTHKNLITFAFSKTYAVKDWFCGKLRLVDKTHIFELKHIGIIVISFLLFTFTRVHPAFIIVSAGLLGAIIG